MRRLADHVVPGDSANHQIHIDVVDERGAGNANHDYQISFDGIEIGRVKFQNGPIKEVGVNGVTHEALLTILIDRLRSFQEGQYRCRENAIALTHLEEGLMWLQRRTVERIKRGVEGTHEK